MRSVTPPVRDPDLGDPSQFINRELSWVRFNRRVLDEALNRRNPLLERVKFLSIFANNLDEFFMIRVSGLKHQAETGVVRAPMDRMSPPEQLEAIRAELLPGIQRQHDCWHRQLKPSLRKAGIRIQDWKELPAESRAALRRYVQRDILPVLTPLVFDPSHPFPHISNLSMNLAVTLEDPEYGERFARLKVPDGFPSLLPAHRGPSRRRASKHSEASRDLVWIEEVIAANLDLLFPGVRVTGAYPFRVTRNADLEIQEDEADDLLAAVEEQVGMRGLGFAVRLEVDDRIPDRIRSFLASHLKLEASEVYTERGPIGMKDLVELTRLDVPALKYPPLVPAVPPPLMGERSVFPLLARRDLLLYHPYDSFVPVVDLVREAARDPAVLAIKMTLYRTGRNSPVVEALTEAREHGKQVAAVVELKARFDEERNIGWARAMERAGVHVVYGIHGLKVHAKMCLIVRRERGRITRYVHLSTGNYNTETARLYADIGYMTRDPLIGKDVTQLFNDLTGYSRNPRYRKLLVSPHHMRREILRRIEREIQIHRRRGGGRLAFKMNSLVDPECIRALYRASQAGVKVDLQVRGICCLRPGVRGVSDTITVTSVVGRFLEHSRIYYFHNGGNPEVFAGSADLMPRNLDGRVEVLFPVEDPRMKRALVEEILEVHLRDNVKARRLLPDSAYAPVRPRPGETPVDSQEWMVSHRRMWNGRAEKKT